MKRSLSIAIAIGMILAASGVHPASAEQPVPDLYLGFEESVSVGDPVVVTAYLVDPAGSPIRGVQIDLIRNATFLNVSGSVSLGSLLTDDSGKVAVSYIPATEGEITINAVFAGSETFAPVTDSGVLVVLPGPEQYREEPPFRVPGTNIWMVVGIIGTVWAFYLIAFAALFRIGSAPDA
jgi:hypothetical protein